ncbi:hypothetical protein ElyMa_002911300, partial [Elysia marginata]
MELNPYTFPQVLWLLFILTRDAHGVNRLEPQPLPNITLVAHKPPAWLYPHHPFQVRCYGWAGEKATLIVKVFSGIEYRENPKLIGLYILGFDRPISIDTPYFSGFGIESEESSGRRKKMAAVFNVCPREKLHGGYISCTRKSKENGRNLGHSSATSDQYGYFQFKYPVGPTKPKMTVYYHMEPQTAIAGETMRIVCIGPTKPKMTVYYHMEPQTAIAGETMRIVCSAFVGLNGRLVFAIALQGKTFQWVATVDQLHNVQSYMFKIHIESIAVMSERGPFIKSEVLIFITEQLDGASFYCFTRDAYTNDTQLEQTRALDTARYLLQVKAFNYKPTLSVKSYIRTKAREWLLIGACKVSKAAAKSLHLVIKTGEWTHAVTASKTANLRRKSVKKDSRNMDTQVTYSFSDEARHSRWIGVYFFIKLKVEAELVTAMCVVNDLQRCQRLRVEKALPAFRVDNVEAGPHNEALEHSSKIVVFSVLGMVVSLVVAVAAKKINRRKMTRRSN